MKEENLDFYTVFRKPHLKKNGKKYNKYITK